MSLLILSYLAISTFSIALVKAGDESGLEAENSTIVPINRLISNILYSLYQVNNHMFPFTFPGYTEYQ